MTKSALGRVGCILIALHFSQACTPEQGPVAELQIPESQYSRANATAEYYDGQEFEKATPGCEDRTALVADLFSWSASQTSADRPSLVAQGERTADGFTVYAVRLLVDPQSSLHQTDYFIVRDDCTWRYFDTVEG